MNGDLDFMLVGFAEIFKFTHFNIFYEIVSKTFLLKTFLSPFKSLNLPLPLNSSSKPALNNVKRYKQIYFGAERKMQNQNQAIYINQVMNATKTSSSNIKVFCRFRPFNQKQIQDKSDKIHRISNKRQLIIRDPSKSEEQSFMYDHVFDTNSTQVDVYQEVGEPVLTNILDGFNGTIMAYGQTSSGKTHTMQGYDLNDREAKGIIPRIIENLFHSIEKSPDYLEFKLKVSIFEVYMEKVRDLLDVSKADLKIRENKSGPYVEHLTEVYISDKIQFYKLIQLGQKNRITCATNMNANSSRSHMIFLLSLNQFNSETSQSKTSKLFLIDLAGSEKISKTGAEGKVLDQAKKINLSLTSLGKVIKSLSERGSHIPYRDSKLTRIIKDSLGGNSKTTLIVTCSPHQMHIPETISTLRFGQNAQKIKNKPKINRQLTVEELQKMIEKLEQSIEEKDHWILALEDYIKNQLNAVLPKRVAPQLVSKENQQMGNSSQPFSEQIKDQYSQINDGQEQDPKKLDRKRSEKQMQISITNQLAYDENVANLEAELSEYKKNLHSQINKSHILKQEYSSLNENIKQLIEENIGLEQTQKQYQEKMQNIKQQILYSYYRNCALVFGQILDRCGDCTGPESCYGGIKYIVDEKGKDLCFSTENSDLVDYWKEEKKKLVEKISMQIKEELIAQGYQKKLEDESSKDEMKELQNEKIMEMEDKIDSLYHEYQEMLALQTSWKVECQLYQRKLKMKEEKICELRNMLKEITDQMEMLADDYEDTVSVRSKIVKPIKGGFLFK